MKACVNSSQVDTPSRMSFVEGCMLTHPTYSLPPAVAVFAGKNSVQRQRMVYKVSKTALKAEQLAKL